MRATRYGDYLVFDDICCGSDVGILAPSGSFVTGIGVNDNPYSVLEMASGVLGEPGLYTIRLQNGQATGAFMLEVGYVQKNGTIINYGDTLPDSSMPPTSSDHVATPSTGTGFPGVPAPVATPFTGIGFPGLPPQDFTDGITIPFVVGQPNAGAINPGFDSVFGFTVDASAGDKFDLTFTRTSGNLNLGLAVLSPDNTIVYQASLVNTERMNALFTFPVSGQYTIGVWKIDLAAPPTPENTAFQLTGTLNP
jgi:hypothetical protein